MLSCQATYTITQDDLDNGKVVNVADVTGVSPTGIVTGTGTTTTPPDQKPSVKMVKTATPNSGTLALGQTITYTMVVTNDGNVTLSNVVVTDTMAGLSALNCTQPITLAPGASNTCTATYVVTQSDLDAGQIVNSALVSVTSPVTPTSPITTTSGVTVTATQTPSLQMVKLASYPSTDLAVGEKITYTMVVTNNGNVTVKNVSSRIRYPACLRLFVHRINP